MVQINENQNQNNMAEYWFWKPRVTNQRRINAFSSTPTTLSSYYLLGIFICDLFRENFTVLTSTRRFGSGRQRDIRRQYTLLLF